MSKASSYELHLEDLSEEHHSMVFQLLERHKECMQTFAQDTNALKAKVEQLEKENQALREHQGKLQAALAGGPAVEKPLGPVVADASDLSPDGQGDGLLRLERQFQIHDAPVHGVTFGKASDVVATASWDGTCKIYELQSGNVVKTIGKEAADQENIMKGLYAVAFAKSVDDIIGCASCDRSVYLWNPETGDLKQKLTGHTDEVNGIDFHHVQQVMATASDDCKCLVWDFSEGIALRTLDKHFKPVYGCTFLGTENEYLLATSCFDQNTRVFDMRDKSVVSLLKLHTDDVIGIHFNSAKRLLATGSDDGQIGIWDTGSWKLQGHIDTKEAVGGENEVKRVAFSPNGAWLAAGCSSGQVLVYNVDTCKCEAVLPGHKECVFDVTWGVDQQTNRTLLVSASHDHTCRFWSAPSSC